MFMRIVQMDVNPDKILEFVHTYERTIIPELQKTRGCIYAGLVQSLEDQSKGLSLTLWETQADAVAYEQSGKYDQLINVSRPFFSDVSEWKLQLSEDLRLEYAPVVPEPEVKFYVVEPLQDGQSDFACVRAESGYLRIVLMRINPGRIQDFIRIYEQEIIPALRLVQGCRQACLVKGTKESNELLSVTIWDSLKHAQTYEATGQFERLTQKVRPTFSDLAQWKMTLDEQPIDGPDALARKVVTSDDIAVRTYSIAVGRAFK